MLNRHSFIPTVLALLFSSSVFSSCSDDTLTEMESSAKETAIISNNITRADNSSSEENYSDCFYKENLQSLNGLNIFIKNSNPVHGPNCFVRIPYKRDFARIEKYLHDDSSFQIWVDEESKGLYSFRLYSTVRGKYMRTSCKLPPSLIGVSPYPIEASQQWFLMPKFNGYAYIGSKAYGYKNAEGRWRPCVMNVCFKRPKKPNEDNSLVFSPEDPNNQLQEFKIVPESRMTVMSVDFDLNNATINELPKEKQVVKVFTHDNNLPYAVNATLGGTFNIEESSFFNVNNDCIEYQILCDENTPEISLPTVGSYITSKGDEIRVTIDPKYPTRQRVDGFRKTSTVTKTVTYERAYNIPEYTHYELIARFRTASIKIPVTVHLACVGPNNKIHNFRTKGIWEGVVMGSPAVCSPVETIRSYPLNK